MAKDWKVQFIFNLGKWGWTETFYGHSDLNDISVARTAAGNLLNARLNFCASDVRCEAIRISDMAAPQLVDLNTSINVTPPSTNGLSNTLWDSALCRIIGSDGTRRMMLFRAPPPSMVNGGPGTNVVDRLKFFSTQYKGLFQDFANNLVDGTSQFFWNIKKSTTGTPKLVLKSLAQDPTTGRFIIETVLPHGYATGQMIIVSGRRYALPSKLIGLASVVQVIDANKVMLNKVNCCPILPPLNGPAEVRPRTITYTDITSVVKVRWVIKKTGGAFFLTAGARSAKRC